MATPRNATITPKTIEQELADLEAITLRDDDGNILATPTDLTWELLSNDKRSIAQIKADAAPIGKLGSVAVADLTSYANECAKHLVALVSKLPLTAGQTATKDRNAIPAGATDWNRSDVLTKAEVEKFYGDVIDHVAVAKWSMAVGSNNPKNFPFRKSVEYFFGKIRREVLSSEMLDLYGLSDGEPAQRITANLANVENAAKRAHKLLEGVEHYPTDFETATKARELLDKIVAQCTLLQAGITRKMNAAVTVANGEKTGTEG